MDYLFRGETKQVDDQLQQEAAAYGVILPDAPQQSTDYHLWAEHRPAVELFMRCATQWRTAADGVIGLDYGVVLQMASLYQVDDLPRAMEDLGVMEVYGRQLINKRS